MFRMIAPELIQNYGIFFQILAETQNRFPFDSHEKTATESPVPLAVLSNIYSLRLTIC